MKLRATAWLIAASALVALWPAGGQAQQAPAGVVTTVQGDAVVVRPASAQPAALKLKDSVFARDRIETRADSIVRVLLGGKAVVTVRELSVFTITEEPGRATIDLASGRAAVGVAKSQLQPGEAIIIRTPNAVAAVRGSLLITEVTQVGGAPQSSFSALAATLPITVTSASDPNQVVALRINEAVNVSGLGTGTALGPVRVLSGGELLRLRGVSAAPKPAETTDKPPARLARQVSGEKAREAAQLGDAISRGDGGAFSASPVSEAVTKEFDQTRQTLIGTQDLIEITGGKIEEVAEATLRSILIAAGAEPPFIPDPDLSLFGGTATLGASETLARFSGTSSPVFAPVVDLGAAEVTQSGGGSLFLVDPGATLHLRGRLVSADNSSITTDGTFFRMGDGATLTSGLGLLPLLEFISSDVHAGGGLVALGSGASMRLERSLLIARNTDFTSGAAPFISFGPSSSVELVNPGALSLLQIRGGSITAGGTLVAMGENASLRTTGSPSIFGLLDFGNDLEVGNSTIVAGGDLLSLDRRASINVSQDLLAADGSTLTIGNRSAGTGTLIAVGSEAQITSSGLQLSFINNTTLSAGGSFLTLGNGATVTSEGTSALALISAGGSTVELGGDVLAMAGGSRLTMDRGLLVASNSLVTAGGSVIDLDAGALLQSGGASAQALVLAFNATEIQTGQDAILLRPGAALTVNRPLLHVSGAAVVAGGSLLNLGAGASLTSPEVTALPLLLVFDGSFVGSQADMVQLGASAQINMVRPLLSGRESDFLSDAGFLHVGAGAVLSSTGEASTLVQLDRGSFVAGGSFTQIDAGGRVAINRPLLLTANASTTFPTGLVTVAPGGQLTTTSADPLVSLLVGTHQIGTASGAAMFSLTGSATALDTESDLILGNTRAVQAPGGLLFTLASTVNGQSAVKVDTALFEASAPLLHLRTASAMTTSRDAVDMSLRAKVTSLGPVVRLDGSSLTVQTGALFNLAGGSFLRVTGDLVELANSSTLSLLNGPVLSANGGSAVNVSGSFVAFTGTGGNRVNITNNLCPCTLVSGVPVALRDGALSTNVTIGPNAIKNPSLGTITLGNANTAAIVLSGPASKVSIAAP